MSVCHVNSRAASDKTGILISKWREYNTNMSILAIILEFLTKTKLSSSLHSEKWLKNRLTKKWISSHKKPWFSYQSFHTSAKRFLYENDLICVKLNGSCFSDLIIGNFMSKSVSVSIPTTYFSKNIRRKMKHRLSDKCDQFYFKLLF